MVAPTSNPPAAVANAVENSANTSPGGLVAPKNTAGDRNTWRVETARGAAAFEQLSVGEQTKIFEQQRDRILKEKGITDYDASKGLTAAQRTQLGSDLRAFTALTTAITAGNGYLDAQLAGKPTATFKATFDRATKTIEENFSSLMKAPGATVATGGGQPTGQPGGTTLAPGAQAQLSPAQVQLVAELSKNNVYDKEPGRLERVQKGAGKFTGAVVTGVTGNSAIGGAAQQGANNALKGDPSTVRYKWDPKDAGLDREVFGTLARERQIQLLSEASNGALTPEQVAALQDKKRTFDNQVNSKDGWKALAADVLANRTPANTARSVFTDDQLRNLAAGRKVDQNQ